MVAVADITGSHSDHAERGRLTFSTGRDPVEEAILRGLSQENVEVVWSFYNAWASNDFPGSIDLMDPDIEYIHSAGP